MLNPATAQIDDKAREYIEKAQDSAKHLGRLFQDLLDVSKAEDGRIGNNPKVVDVTDFAADIVEGLRPKAEEKNLRLMFKPRPDGEEHDRFMAPVFYANVDNDHLREVIANLTENAIKYTLKGDVIIDVTGNEKTVTISVQDSGLGIPAEDIPHLFQKFYRVDSTDTREIGGTGLGLYLCRRLSEIMNGHIKVKSVYKQGSTFSLEIPRIEHEEAIRLLETASVEAEKQQQQPQIRLEAQPRPIQMPTSQTQPKQTTDNILPPAPAPPKPPQAAPTATVTPPPPVQAQAPQAPRPQPAQPQPVANPQPNNTPLSKIEANPASYQASRAPVNVPARTDSRPNQT